MNRLTEHIEGLTVSKERYIKHSPCHYCEYQSTSDCLMEECTYANALNKLAAYEDGGLEPEQVSPYNKELVDTILEQLKEYEDLEEQGRLIKLPCKVGDTVYIYADFTKNIEPYTIDEIHLGSCYAMQFDCNLCIGDELIDGTEFELEDIGKTVFLTREEAEKALEAK
jgi:hypothetical protein